VTQVLEKKARIFKALGDETRLAILRLLRGRSGCSCPEVKRGEPGLCVCDLVERLAMSQSTVSHHLEILRRAGLVLREQRGQWAYYRRDEESIEGLGEQVVRGL
jgi:ArsR family transcriptional regulator